MAKISNLNGHLNTFHMIESSACSCIFINEDEFHFFVVCPLYNSPRITLQNGISHVAPFMLRTLLYGTEHLSPIYTIATLSYAREFRIA